MKRLALLVLLVLFLPLLAFADDVVRCESKDGHRRRCPAGDGRITLEKQLSLTECVEGTSWGWRRGEVWVDNGCRADFRIWNRRDEYEHDREGSDREDRDGRIRRDRRLLVCESEDGRLHRCAADMRGGVELNRQLSKRDCIRNETWGWDEDGVWVDRGCRAEFSFRAPRRRDDRGHTETVVCESKDARKHFCPVDTSYGVELRRQLSVSDCTFRQTWGYSERGIWVKDGCRAEFIIRGR